MHELRTPTPEEAEALNEAGVRIKPPRTQYAKPWLVRKKAKPTLRWVWRDRSKYAPHQGPREMARRVRQMEAQS